MALHLHSCSIKTSYPFLAHPPPQKRRPLQPLPLPPSSRPSPDRSPAQATRGLRRRSSTFSAIASWAAHVQPGSPASPSPRSPPRRPSLRKGRCPSTASIRSPSTPFLHHAPTPTTAIVPTPSVRDFKVDLTSVGYTSVFLQLPNTPISATLSLSVVPPSHKAPKNIPVPPVSPPACKPRGLARFRSLSAIRSRARSKSACPDSPTKIMAKAAATSAAIVKRKQAKYAMRPPPLANELALMQFVDGGDMDSNIKRIMQVHARATGAVDLADVYRDSEGGIWWDQDEKWEYAHLLAEGDESRPHATGDLQWVTFGSNMSPLTVGVPGEDRRGSVSTQDSDLDPKYVVQPADSLDGDHLALFGSTIVPTRKPSASHISVSSRPCPTAQHLRKPDFLVDVAFPRPRVSPKSPKFETSGVGAGIKPKGKAARRRPTPLKLSPPSPVSKRPTNSPIDADKARRDFIAASFEPVDAIPVTPVTPATAVPATTPMNMRARLVGNSRAINVSWPSLGIKRKPSMLNMMGLFRSARKEDVMC